MKELETRGLSYQRSILLKDNCVILLCLRRGGVVNVGRKNILIFLGRLNARVRIMPFSQLQWNRSVHLNLFRID